MYGALINVVLSQRKQHAYIRPVCYDIYMYVHTRNGIRRVCCNVGLDHGLHVVFRSMITHEHACYVYDDVLELITAYTK